MNSEITMKIKALGDRVSGSALLELMDFYRVTNLSSITQEQAEYFYKLKKNGGKSNGEKHFSGFERNGADISSDE